MKILHIVPYLSRSTDEMFDFALTVANGLQEQHHIEAEFFGFMPSEQSALSINGFDAFSRNKHSNGDISSIASKDIGHIVLHVGKTTYQAPGVEKLLNELNAYLDAHSISMTSLFHEIPTHHITPFFFFNFSKRRITQQIADLSSSVVTNNHLFEQHIRQLSNVRTTCINNFSRVGELHCNNLLGASRRNMVIFGGVERTQIYRNKKFIRQIAEATKIDKIVDIGPELKWSRINTRGINIHKMGHLTINQASDQLTISRIGLLDYTRYPGCLGKSNVFNAYISHGVAPITLKTMKSEEDNIVEGINYFTPDHLTSLRSERTISKMAQTNHDNYQTHNQEQWVNLIKELANAKHD